MKKFILILSVFAFTTPLLANASPDEKPTQHLKLANVTSMEDARKIFIDKTSEIKNYKKLDATELHQIHMITYTLEKSVAYFVENMKQEKQELAKKIAVIVEDIHINSENNRKNKIELHLARYFKLADKIIAKL